MSDPASLILSSKSTWLPAISREHAFARVAVSHGHPTAFLERPRDIRALRSPRGARILAQSAFARADAYHEGVRVVPIAVIAPGHRSFIHETLEVRTLTRTLSRLDARAAAVVVASPWRWPAAMAGPAGRRVFDCDDDWSDLIPRRRARFRELYRRVAAEADEVIVVNPELGDLFPGRSVRVIPNGVASEVLDRASAAPVHATMTYLGTLTDRLDTTLLDEVLRRLPEWRLEIFGPCRYPKMADSPGSGLRSLLASHRDRVRWHGPIERNRVCDVLDRAEVLVVPHRRSSELGGLRGWGGDVIKLYEYAARGRPIVSTSWSDGLAASGPPGLRVVEGARAFAQAVASATQDESEAGAQRAWARQRTWAARWPHWSSAVFGTVAPGGSG